MIVSRVICIVIGYVFGLFQTGYLYGKRRHIDIRQHGSGNAGATNTVRTMGWKAGLIVFLGDCAKTMLAMLTAWLLFRGRFPQEARLLEMYAGLGSVLGHNYPFYLKFKGGKGISCTSAFILAFYPPMAPLCIAVFAAAVLITKYVSLGSILVVVVYFIELVAFGQMGFLGVEETLLPEAYAVGAAFSLLAIWRHRGNIGRLIAGTENKFSSRGTKSQN